MDDTACLRTAPAEPQRTGHQLVTSPQWSRRTWLLLGALCGALFLDGLDISMVGVALPSLGRDFAMSPGALQWIVSGYVLGFGGLLLLGGRSADLLGRRSVFLISVAVFGVASVASAWQTNELALIALRFVKGSAAAFTVPAGLSIITTTFAEGQARDRALTIYGACGASGFSMGLILGGALTEISWRATFLLPGPLALGLVVAGLLVVPRTERPTVLLRSFDLLGALAVTAALLLLVYAVVEAPNRGWGNPITLALLGASVVLGALFVGIERRHPHPLVRLGILRSTRLVHANLTACLMFGAYVAFQFVLVLYLQNVLVWSPMTTAVALLPGGLLVMASASRMDVVLARVGTLPLIVVGMVAFTVAYALFLRVEPGMAYAAFLLPTTLLIGVGFACCFPSINSQATKGVRDDEQGLASGLVNTSLQVGGAVMLAVVSAVLSSGAQAGAGDPLPRMTAAVTLVVVVSAVGAAIAAALLVVERRGQRRAG